MCFNTSNCVMVYILYFGAKHNIIIVWRAPTQIHFFPIVSSNHFSSLFSPRCLVHYDEQCSIKSLDVTFWAWKMSACWCQTSPEMSRMFINVFSFETTENHWSHCSLFTVYRSIYRFCSSYSNNFVPDELR